LRWNEREKQKSFVVVEEDNEPVKKQSDRQKAEDNMTSQPSPEASIPEQAEHEGEEQDQGATKGKGDSKSDGEESDDEDEEEEEDYDIDEWVIPDLPHGEERAKTDEQ
jgi:NAD+ kinase